MKKNLLLIVLVTMLGACSTDAVDKDVQVTQDWTVNKLYTEAHQDLENGNYTRAIKLYDILQSRYPYGRFAQQAQMDKAYAYYKDEEKEKALEAIERFQTQYPTHPETDYILYLKGLTLFNEYKSFFDKFADQDWSDRDPSANKAAYFAFSELLQKYPNSRYVGDATDRISKIVNALGGHEMAVARYYMNRGAYLSAANRAQSIVKNHQNTPYVEESLAMMMSAYQKMNQTQLSADAKRVLESNYPESPYLKKGWFHKDKSWWRY